MRRGTTPTIELNIKGVEMADIAEWYITIQQDSVQLTKTNEDIEIVGTLITIPLTQEETMLFKQGEAFIQIRAITTDELVIASAIRKLDDIERILYNEVIGNESTTG